MTDNDSYERGMALVRSAFEDALANMPREVMRKLAAERRYGPYEPSGAIWEDYRARHNGEEYQGGPVCWPPELCVGSCTACTAPPKENK